MYDESGRDEVSALQDNEIVEKCYHCDQEYVHRDGEGYDCPKCSVRPRLLSVYAIGRCYGGPEEGGWWYDVYEYIGPSVMTAAADIERRRAEIQATLVQPRFDRYSCAGGDDMRVLVEDYREEHVTRDRPRYE